MASADPKAIFHEYLRGVREALLWRLDGLSEYDIRRPLTPTGTNPLGAGQAPVNGRVLVLREDLPPPRFRNTFLVDRSLARLTT
jgi:hypothetical protein